MAGRGRRASQPVVDESDLCHARATIIPRLWQPCVVAERSWLERAVFGITLVVLIAGAAGGDWNGGTMHAALAAHVEHGASAPLYGLLADVANLLPAGEPMFRLGVLAAF